MGTNTGIGIGIGIPFKNNALGGDRPYLPPELKARLIGVWDNYGKKNTDADRNIIKNKIPNAGGDLEILNAAYKLNSGFGKYSEDFTTWTKSSKITSVDSESFDFVTNVNWNLLYYKSNIGKDIPSFKVHIKLKGEGKVFYNYITSEGVFTNKVITSEEYVVPISYNTKYTSETPVNCGFSIGVTSEECSGTITQIPNFEGAFVTDGINDMIISQKTLQEMGVTKELTIVSMIHQISWRSSASVPLTNQIRPTDNIYARNQIADIGKTGIYGYAVYDVNHSNANNSHVINTILGDKNDYSIHITGNLSQGKFSVQGYINGDNNIVELSQVAWYWTFIAKRVLTTDEINQVIAYYNLDKYVMPDIYYDVKKQGLTNDNHAQFGDKLIDYSGNGRDLQLFNIGWNQGSGIGKYVTNFGIWSKDAESNISYNSYSFTVNGSLKRTWLMWHVTELPSFKIKVSGINSNGYVDYGYYDNGSLKNFRLDKDGIHTLPPSGASSNGHGFKVNDTSLDWTGLVIEQIPDFAGALCFDGVDDFGINKDVPTFTDFTVIAKRTWLEENTSDKPFIIKGDSLYPDGNQNAFLFEYGKLSTYSFGQNNKYDESVVPSLISYATTYSYNGVIPLVRGSATDTIGIDVAHSTKIALYFLMLFPYSMSKFLIERQLKKHKLGTFYPNMVEFRPVIKANANYKITCYQIDSTNTWKLIKVGDYIVIGAKLAFQITFDNDASELKEVVSPQLSDIIVEKRPSNPGYNIYSYITSKSPQKINITIDEYIRYEDIVQPYPVIFQITDRNTNQRYSWGDKIKVGSSIRLSQGEKPNLLSGLYSIQSYEYEGETYSYNQLTNLNIILTKQSISLSCNKTWLLDDNEPKCILSPRLLRIPNSSYKILGYIPDISGHGNHGKINNSAYEGMSGVNGYPVVFGKNKTWVNESNGYVTNITSNTIHITNVLNAGLALLYSYVKYNGNLQNIKEIPPFKIEIKGLEGRSKFVYKYLATSNATKETNLYLGNGTHELPKSFLPTEALINNAVVGFSISPIEEGVTNFLSDITIKVLSEYEGAYCFDGVDDSVTIPTTVGGKQVLMKVNWDDVIANAIIYDQIGYPDEFAIYNADKDNSNNPVFAYQARNTGQTYIDGILNSNIKASELKAITHNITITNKLSSGTNNSSPTIGSNKHSDSFFTKMALYDFMLFDDISTDDKIKELNKYVGVEAKVELPPYYWDTYGKTNSDADRDVIQQRGIAVGDYDLTNYNHAYDKMSGYGGYKFAKFDNELDWYLTPDNGYIDVVSRNGYSITLRNLSTSNYGWYFQNSTVKEFITKDIPFKVKANKSIKIYWDMHSYKSNGENFGYVVNNITLNPNEDTSINLRHLTEEELTKLDANKDRMYYLLWFDLSALAVDEEVTIEMLPLYPNGLAYDGITDYSKNANIPVLTDYTYIYKRTIINIPTNAATLLKGADKTNGGAFIADYGNKWQFNFGQYNTIQGIADGINWQTVNSFNGTSINKGENTDDSGITVAKFSNGYTSMVFYKLILYPKTISLLEINFLKNLMEKDEIIDLNNPIFIKNE